MGGDRKAKLLANRRRSCGVRSRGVKNVIGKAFGDGNDNKRRLSRRKFDRTFTTNYVDRDESVIAITKVGNFSRQYAERYNDILYVPSGIFRRSVKLYNTGSVSDYGYRCVTSDRYRETVERVWETDVHVNREILRELASPVE